MIFMATDLHGMGGVTRVANNLPPNTTKGDYLIVLGDFGVIWGEKTLQNDLKKLKEMPITILFIDGNHENFSLLNRFEIKEWCGGKIHQITDNCFHLMRGQIFKIYSGKKTIKFATFGGANSKDKELRLKIEKETGNKCWWEEESITENDYEEMKKNVAAYGNDIDYFISHCPSALVKIAQYNEDIENYSYASEEKLPTESEYFVKKAIELFPKDITCICGHEHSKWERKILNNNYIILDKTCIAII